MICRPVRSPEDVADIVAKIAVVLIFAAAMVMGIMVLWR